MPGRQENVSLTGMIAEYNYKLPTRTITILYVLEFSSMDIMFGSPAVSRAGQITLIDNAT